MKSHHPEANQNNEDHVLRIVNKVCRRFFTVIFPNHMIQNTLYILRTNRHIPHCSSREMLRDTLQTFWSCKLARWFAHSPFLRHHNLLVWSREKAKPSERTNDFTGKTSTEVHRDRQLENAWLPRREKHNIGAADNPHIPQPINKWYANGSQRRKQGSIATQIKSKILEWQFYNLIRDLTNKNDSILCNNRIPDHCCTLYPNYALHEWLHPFCPESL
jgi:hypothetical protein